MINLQHTSKRNDISVEQNHLNHSKMPLMSVVLSPVELSRSRLSSYRTSISEPNYSSLPPAISISDDNFSTTSTLINRINISKYHFAHVIKVPHGTNLIASDHQSTTVCVNSNGNIIHLITPTGYHIRSSRWPENERKIIDLLWCEILQVYLAITSKNLYTLKYDFNQSLSVEKRLDFLPYFSSSNIIIACNSYRLYIHSQSNNSIEVYTLQFSHLHSKRLSDSFANYVIEAFSCSDSYLVISYKEINNKIVILDPITMMMEYEFDLSYTKISSLRCFNDETTLVFIAMRQNGENRLVFFNFENETSPMIVEKAIEHDAEFISLLPNCQDLMILNVTVSRVQFLKYRS